MLFEPLEDRRVLAGNVFATGALLQNQVEPFDVNADTFVTPVDLLVVVNRLNQDVRRPEGESAAGSVMYPDVNGDSLVSPGDALRVLNHLSRHPEASGEGCSGVPTPSVTIDPLPTDVNEMQQFTLSGTMPDAYGAYVDMGPGWQQVSFVADSATFTWSMTGFYTDDIGAGTSSDTHTISATAVNDCDPANATRPITVHNVDPTISIAAPSETDEGSQVSITVTYGDAAAPDPNGTYLVEEGTIMIDWGDGFMESYPFTGRYVGPFAPFPSLTATHTYVDDNPTGSSQDNYTITATITDDDTGTATTSTILVRNVAPTVTIDSITPIDRVLATDENGEPADWLNPGQLDESEGFIVTGTVTGWPDETVFSLCFAL